MIQIKSYADALKAAAEAVFEYYTDEKGTFYYGYREDVNQAKNVYPIIVAERGRFPLVTVRDKGYKITQQVLVGKLAKEADVNSDIDKLQEYANYFINAINVQSFLKVSSIHSAMEMVQTPKGFMPDNSVWIMFNIDIEAWGCETEILPIPGGGYPSLPDGGWPSDLFTIPGQLVYADEDLNPVVLDPTDPGGGTVLNTVFDNIKKIWQPKWMPHLSPVIPPPMPGSPPISNSYTTVAELPALIPEGQQVLYNGTMWRGLLAGESSLPAGTPWPVKGYKEYVAHIFWNGTGIDVIKETINTVGQLTWNAQTGAQMGVLLPYPVNIGEVIIENSYFVAFDYDVIGTVNIHLGNNINGKSSDIHFDCYTPGGDFDGTLLQANQGYYANFKFYPPPPPIPEP